ncbi:MULTISPECIES: class C sortase [Enterococcus]|uniref:class C sortase n=1 Tax=Enterococcus TaxID=1350 RepID=UPI00189E80D8|nr:class C sortase [Enterococcus dispar]
MTKPKTTKGKMTKDEKINMGLKFAMVILFLVGAAIFSYPFVVDSLNNYIDQQRIESYQKELQQKNKKEADALKKKKAAENAKMAAQGTNIPGMGIVADPFEENVGQNTSPGREYFAKHTVGAIYIPKINVSLPVFDTTNDVLLDKGATILQGSSFPIGGKSTHSVITGHTGLPDKMLFTDVDKLKKDDKFYLEILDEKLAYMVTSIQTVLPNELDKLRVVPNEDLVTLVTCTPYMVNSHRLLVTGSRILYEEAMTKQIQKTKEYHKRRLIEYIAIIVLLLTLFFYWVWRKVVLIRSRKRTYDLTFRVVDANTKEPISGQKFRLLDHRGRSLEGTATFTKEASSAENGWVIFEQIPGNIYHVAWHETPKPYLKAKVARLNDKRLKLKTKKGLLKKVGQNKERNYQMDWQGGRYEEKST